MKRQFLVLLVSMIILPGLLAACTSSKVTPETKPEPEIPTDYSTYTSEGLFSISYPPDWTPMTSIMEELMETSKELMEISDPELELDDIEMLFFGGLPIDDDNFLPNVSICVTARGFGYWDLDEIVDVETLYSKETTHGYREYSRIETVVDGNKAVIIENIVISSWKTSALLKRRLRQISALSSPNIGLISSKISMRTDISSGILIFCF